MWHYCPIMKPMKMHKLLKGTHYCNNIFASVYTYMLALA